MNWVHMGVSSRSEENADRFFGAVLGLAKAGPKTLPASVSEGCFGVPADLLMIRYDGAGLQFEVLIVPQRRDSGDPIVHGCFAVADRAALIARAEAQGLDIRRVSKGGATLVFMRDCDGNLYEIKEEKP